MIVFCGPSDRFRHTFSGGIDRILSLPLGDRRRHVWGQRRASSKIEQLRNGDRSVIRIKMSS